MAFNSFWQYDGLEDIATFKQLMGEYIRAFKIGDVASIANANGFSLDLIGKIMGIDERPQLLTYIGSQYDSSYYNTAEYTDESSGTAVQRIDDGNYRKLLNIRSRQLLEPRSLNNLLRIMVEFFPNVTFTYNSIENEVNIEYDLSTATDQETVLLQGGYFLTPQGCLLNITGV